MWTGIMINNGTATSREFSNGNAANRQTPSELALRASECSYRRLFEAAQDGILILDAESGRITDANPFLVKLLGRPLFG